MVLEGYWTLMGWFLLVQLASLFGQVSSSLLGLFDLMGFDSFWTPTGWFKLARLVLPEKPTNDPVRLRGNQLALAGRVA